MTASAFQLRHTGTNWAWFANAGATAGQIFIGTDPSLPEGISWGYGACQSGKFYIGNSLYNMTSSDPCASVEVVAFPFSGIIEGIDCDPAQPLTLVADGSILTMNDPGEDCDCGIVVPVKSSNWGQIKALYGTTN